MLFAEQMGQSFLTSTLTQRCKLWEALSDADFRLERRPMSMLNFSLSCALIFDPVQSAQRSVCKQVVPYAPGGAGRVARK
jgi:hypothetical protein